MRVVEKSSTTTVSVPHPPGRLPLVGDVLGVSLHTPVQDSMRLERQLGPIFERKALGHRFVFVSGADMVAELSDESRFAKNVAPGIAELRGIGGDGLFTAYNEEPNWARAHNLLRPAFTQAAMRSYHDIMVTVAGELAEHWDTHVDGAPVDVSSDMTKLTLETIGRAGFSYSFDSFRRERPHPFVEAMVRALTHAQRRTFRKVPLVSKLLYRRSDRQNEQDTAYLAQVVDEVIRQRRDSDAEGPEDLLEIMLRAAREEDPNRLDEVNIRNQVVTFLVAGHETTSGALSFALHYLAQHPEILAKARAEVDAVWGDGTPTFEQVAKLRYVRRVLDETLRLWPTAPAYAREAREDTVLANRYPMRAGEWVLVLIPSLHRDPAWGSDPERFDPDRFAPERVRGRAPHIYKPFGTGERACIGRQFAIHEAVLVLGTILRRYDFTADPDYQLRIQERLTLMPVGFTLSLRRRRI
ncbi:cytochrome P450 [Rhodococcus hoagii]|uniref:Unspecific monooxygenase n=1 Tax=Prescottella equi ATCC 33707 TaxID=525370 RepID=E9T180_RHOHA|nr:cytochrome P450 [Prescottella equi]EGD24181.1 unspecific monooxygenase [Prescottella equi ATCC 33707]MBM4527898.1 cytochrome P450 [Prescottella equi]MBM4546404.1 cytochrome P450 [Prescottella equi]MBM4573225.1 cytochrome P450 [Prescottella equi]MBM4606279.1 cytochrome P450 [Prescottella equi]